MDYRYDVFVGVFHQRIVRVSSFCYTKPVSEKHQQGLKAEVSSGFEPNYYEAYNLFPVASIHPIAISTAIEGELTRFPITFFTTVVFMKA